MAGEGVATTMTTTPSSSSSSSSPVEMVLLSSAAAAGMVLLVDLAANGGCLLTQYLHLAAFLALALAAAGVTGRWMVGAAI